MKKLLLLFTTSVIFLSSCTDTIDKKISPDTFADDLKKIQTDHGKTYDSADFATLAMGVGLGKLMGAEKQMEDKTYRQFLDELKADREKELRAQAEKMAKYEKELAEWKEAQKKLNSIVAFKIIDKDFVTDEYGIREQQGFKYSLQNNSGKQIKAIKGGFNVFDSFGKVVGRYGVERENPLTVGQNISNEIYYDFNSYDSDAAKVKKVALKDLKYEWQTAMVIFSDGSVMEAEEEPAKPELL